MEINIKRFAEFEDVDSVIHFRNEDLKINYAISKYIYSIY